MTSSWVPWQQLESVLREETEKKKFFFLKLLNSDTIKSNWISAQLYFKGNFICPFILEWSLMCVERIALQQVPQGQFQPHKECHKLHLTQVGLQSQPIWEKLVMLSMMIQRKNLKIKGTKIKGPNFWKFWPFSDFSRSY